MHVSKYFSKPLSIETVRLLGERLTLSQGMCKYLYYKDAE
jgi:hypothetical protein